MKCEHKTNNQQYFANTSHNQSTMNVSKCKKIAIFWQAHGRGLEVIAKNIAIFSGIHNSFFN